MRFALFKFYFTFSVLICLSGCIAESSFKLSDQSRLPKWFELPEGKKRSDFSVTLHYYVKPDGREARLVFKQDDRWLSSETVVGKLSGLKPLHLEKASADDNHEYEIITANGSN